MKNIRRTYFSYFILFALSASVFLTSNLVKKNVKHDKNFRETLIVPHSGFLKSACLGFRNLAADLIWIRTIRYVFVHNKTDKLYPALKDLLFLTTELDIHFKDIYRIGGEMLRELADDEKASLELLHKGKSVFPRNWEIHYELGKTYDSLEKTEVSTKYFEEALGMPNAPSWLAVHVAEGYYKQKNYERALYWWELITVTTESTEIYRSSASKALFIRALMGANKIASGCREFYVTKGMMPDNPEQLLDSGIMDSLPEEPFGSYYEINKENMTVDAKYINKIHSNCIRNINRRLEVFREKYGYSPESLNELKGNEVFGVDFPKHPYDGEFYLDEKTGELKSSIDFLVRIDLSPLSKE